MNLDALAAEPQQPRAWRVATAAEAEELRALVNAIYVADSEADRIEAQRAALLDAEAALRCYRAILRERWGDLRACAWCANLHNRSCAVGKPGGMVDARRGYQPEPYRARRCPGYLPPRFDPDQRSAAQRWPGLINILETDT